MADQRVGVALDGLALAQERARDDGLALEDAELAAPIRPSIRGP